MDLVTIRDVELISVGMKWPSANGDITFTFEHLQDAMVAANEDPHVVPPRLKIGHTDPRFNSRESDHDPYFDGDGEPAVGVVRNLRLWNDGSMLVGDYENVPAWLADVLPAAYPSRSIEGAWSMTEGAAGEALGSWDVTTPGGKRYSFVLTACALLGVSRPAVQNLEDLRLFLTDGDGVVVAGAAPDGGQPVAATIGDVPAPQPAMSADVEKVFDVFVSDFADGPDDPRYWWWPISLWADSGTLYVDDDDGGIQAVPYSTDDEQGVSFDEPYPVVHRFEKAPAAAAMASVLEAGEPDVVFRNVAETPVAARHAERAKGAAHGGSPESSSVSGMDVTTLSDTQRANLVAALSLAEDASDEDITARLDGELEPVEDVEETTDDEATDEAAEDKPPAETSAGPETVTVDAAVFEDMKAKVARLSEQEDKRLASERGAAVEAACAAGKILPSAKAAWLKKVSLAPEATLAELDELQPGLVPVDETGHSRQEDPAAVSDDVAGAYQHFIGRSPSTKEQG